MNAILTAVLNSAIPGATVAAAVWLALRLAPGRILNAATRYAAWWAAMALVIALPVLYLPAGPHQPLGAGGGTQVSEPELVLPSYLASPLIPRVAPATVPCQTAIRRSLAWPSLPIMVPEGRWQRWFLPAWLTAGLLLLIRLAVSWHLLQRQTARAFDAPLELQARAAEWLARCGSARRGVRVAASTEIAIPVATGPRRPSILIPARLFGELDHDALEQIGLHEAAHLARGDDYALAIERVIEALFALHPVVRWIARRIDLEREIACDDFVVAATGQTRSYAACLTRMVELGGSNRPALAAGAAEGRSHLAKRVDTILDGARHTGTRLLKARLAAIVAVLAAMAWIAARAPAVLAFPAPPQQQGVPAASQPRSTGPKARPEIRGMVVEPGTNAAVSDAEVTLDFLGADQPRFMPSPAKASFTAKTDTSGAFAFLLDQVGYYVIRTKREGYSESGQITGSPSSQNITLTGDAPSTEVRLYLSRPGKITGRVVDEESRKPIANLKVLAGRAYNFAGRRMFLRTNATTGADGQFEVSGLPGEYIVEIGPQTRGKDRVMTKFSEDDLKRVDQDYEQTFWPGGHSEDAALPVTIASGATVDVGPVPVKKTEYYRVHARVPSSDCGPQETMQVYEVIQGYQMEMNYLEIAPSVPCGADMLISGFAPGSHRLILSINKRPRATRGMASVPFSIAGRNIEIVASLAPGVAVDGRFIAEDNAKPPDFTTLKIWLDPIDMLRFADLVEPVAADATGKFQLQAVPSGNVRVMISGTGAGNYVKEIRYNGSPLRDGIVSLDQASMTRSLTIVIDDKPASLTGEVKNGDKAVSQPYVILAKWPLAGGRVFIPTATATGSDQGAFQFSGLAPGEYRVAALRSRVEDQERLPNTLERALAAARKIELGPNTFQNITIGVTEVR